MGHNTEQQFKIGDIKTSLYSFKDITDDTNSMKINNVIKNQTSRENPLYLKLFQSEKLKTEIGTFSISISLYLELLFIKNEEKNFSSYSFYLSYKNLLVMYNDFTKFYEKISKGVSSETILDENKSIHSSFKKSGLLIPGNLDYALIIKPASLKIKKVESVEENLIFVITKMSYETQEQEYLTTINYEDFIVLYNIITEYHKNWFSILNSGTNSMLAVMNEALPINLNAPNKEKKRVTKKKNVEFFDNDDEDSEEEPNSNVKKQSKKSFDDDEDEVEDKKETKQRKDSQKKSNKQSFDDEDEEIEEEKPKKKKKKKVVVEEDDFDEDDIDDSLDDY